MPTYKMGSRGKHVTALQEALLKLDYALPKWGADGSFGVETMGALQDFAHDHGEAVPDEEVAVRQALVDLVLSLAAGCRRASHRGADVVDLTGSHPGAKRKDARAWSAVTGIVLHQTGIKLANKPARWHSVAAHIGVPALAQPTVYYINPITTVMWHANGFNASTVGIEVNGCFEGIDGKPKTAWPGGGGINRATDAQIEAPRHAVKWVCDEVAAHGGRVTHLFAHRQSSAMRQSDPGSRLWQEVGLWGQAELKLSDGGDDCCIGTGRPIPKQWDPSRTGTY